MIAKPSEDAPWASFGPAQQFSFASLSSYISLNFSLRKSGASLQLTVQPILELSELSNRKSTTSTSSSAKLTLPNSVADDAVRKTGTLQRTSSFRFGRHLILGFREPRGSTNIILYQLTIIVRQIWSCNTLNFGLRLSFIPDEANLWRFVLPTVCPS